MDKIQTSRFMPAQSMGAMGAMGAMGGFLLQSLGAISFCTISGMLYAQPLQDVSIELKSPNTALVRSLSADSYNKVMLVSYDPKTKGVISQRLVNISCQRLYASGATIFCLGAPAEKINILVPQLPRYVFYDTSLKALSTSNLLAGSIVSRARLSLDAKYASSTAFKTSAGYGQGGLSTEALILDPKGKAAPQNIEDYQLTHQGKKIKPVDLNVWGVTFDPKQSHLFYATAAFEGITYLAKGNILLKTLITVAPNIECPSLSPDGKWLAFKSKRTSGGWNPSVMNLATSTQTVFDEPEGMDDQIEWLDNQTLVYEKAFRQASGLKMGIVMRDIMQAKGDSKLWLLEAGSPSIMRR